MVYLSKHSILLLSAALMIAGITRSYAQKRNATIRVDPTKIEAEITPYLYGSCIEDVNHEIYGGLYDQKIFGESFEEPVPNPQFVDFAIYEGNWTVSDGEVRSTPHPGSKLVYKKQAPKDGSIEVELKFNGGGDNAGLILHTSQPGNGADNFYGYEISLSSNGKKVVIGKHKKNWEPIKEMAVACNPAVWNNLKAVVKGQRISILLNGKEVFAFDNRDPDLQTGCPALRVWNSHVVFRNFKLTTEGQTQTLTYDTLPSKQISSQWDAFEKGTVETRYRLEATGAYNGENAQTIELLSGKGAVGIANSGLNRWGIAVRKGQKLQGRLHLKAEGYKGVVTVVLQSADGKTEYARQQISGIGGQWKKHTFSLLSNATDRKARFVVYIDRPGKVCVDQVTLMSTGKDQFKGLPFRSDIGQAMVDQKLTFLRYGGTMINTPGYRFKKMIGDPDKRAPYQGHWYRYSTNGFGIEEFLKFSEAAGFTAAFAVNIEETPQDMADMIEYLNGPATSKWGKIRAQNGHPKPYHVKYIGIGNEEVLFNGDRADEYDHYIERFLLLHDAIKAKDPSVKLVNTAWWRPDSPSIEKVFKALDGKADYWDYHPWADALTSGKTVADELKQMKELFLKWNPQTTMKCAIFEENGNTHNIERALGHVTLQNAVRRMGDFVLTSCAANALQPYLQNDNGWDQGQIFFTPSQVWGMPPYYAQQMASENHLPLLVSSELTDGNGQLDVTATRSKDSKRIVLHIANTGEMPVATTLDLKGIDAVQEISSMTLSGGLKERNTPEAPTKIIPVKKALSSATSGTFEIAPHSYTVLIIKVGIPR